MSGNWVGRCVDMGSAYTLPHAKTHSIMTTPFPLCLFQILNRLGSAKTHVWLPGAMMRESKYGDQRDPHLICVLMNSLYALGSDTASSSSMFHMACADGDGAVSTSMRYRHH